ncbi:PDZ domain-containing protein [Mariniblastus fucicola]|uniref:Putative periplasmic serine endoprotease DegP-like n=1 Tax=Mariniblastus fucicola TaxID=980251 RepID=A0A5B9PB54_9BACT|nr:PDZ domain-containing protein [Mariniblastus fucicola]QEG21746.1 putative periplasmic serine endoprotease DegP-like precursor [Mariniblastus fucicola]
MKSILSTLLATGLTFVFAITCVAQDEAVKASAAAIRYASQSVVQIDTVGGLTPQGQSRSTAAFSGTVVSADGLIVTASYNLLHQPASVFVKFPAADGERPDATERVAAEIVATDSSRNLTLLKIDRDEMVPITFANETSVRVGERAIAIGKSVSMRDANVSFGIVSAKGRIWNRATQTDAKISRQNYGGPLVTLSGQAIGILVPMQHSSSEVAAGSQWYDSGIGFAANVDAESDAFKRFLGGESLRAGLIGVSFEGQDENADPAKVSFCLPTSPAGKAGLKVGDTIVKAAGKLIVRQAQFKHLIGPLYEKETLSVVVERDGKTLEFGIELAGEIDPYVEPEFGVLLRLATEVPIIETVIPESPAAEAELKSEDVITKVNDAEIASADEFREAHRQLVVGEPISLEVERAGKSIELSLTPRRQLADILKTVPLRNTGAAREFESIEIAVAEGSNKCLAFVPQSDDADEEDAESKRPQPPVLVWVPSPGPVDAKAMFRKFENFCSTNDALVLIPQSVDPEKWLPDDASVIAKALDRLAQRASFDPRRVAIAGKGPGGEMALLTAFSNRKLFAGVAMIDAELSTSQPNLQSLPSTKLHLMVLGAEGNQESIQFFREKGFSIFEDPSSANALERLAIWLRTLDRL